MQSERNKNLARKFGSFTAYFSAVLLLLIFTASQASAAKALFVVGGGKLSEGDRVIKDHLTGKGFKVVVGDDRKVTGKSAVGKDLVVISESVVSSRLKNRFREVRVPVICLEVYHYDNLGMTARELYPATKFGYVEEQQNVQIHESSSPLAIHLPAGYVVEVSPKDTTMGWGLAGNHAIKVATLLNSADKYAIFAYPKGAKMPGLVAPAKRIGFFLTSKAAKSLSAEGWKLFNAAVAWAVAYEEPEGCPEGYASLTFVNNCGATIWIAQLGNGASRPCSSNADCGINGQDGNCTNGACAQILCQKDQDCNSSIQFCNVSNCSSDNDCPAINCYTDSDCPFASDNSTPQQCIGGGLCSSDGDCPAIACTTTADCPPIAGVTCDPSTSFCTNTCQSNGFCICNSNSNCPGPFATCQNNLCSETVGYCSSVCRPDGQCSCVSQSSSGLPVSGCTGVGQTCQSNLCTGIGMCQYKNVPSPGYWQLPTPTGSNTEQICVPANNKDASSLAWGGRFWARTGCPDNFASCKPEGALCDNNTACCNNSCQSGQCQPGIPACQTGDCKTALNCQVSGSLPVTLFEVNYAAPNVVYYDVSLADSYNLPMQAVPSVAGCVAAGCTGNLNETCPQLLQNIGSTSCTGNSECPAGGVCVSGQCVQGCISACNQCRAGVNTTALNCAVPVPGGDGTTTYEDLYCCTNNISCNQGSPTCFGNVDCATLGCINDADCGSDNCTARGVCAEMMCNSTTSLCNPTLTCQTNSDCNTQAGYSCVGGACVPPTNCCGPYNPQWLTAMQSYASTFKTACPAAYSYQFDDPSSSFTCPNTGNGVNYQITFCPSPTP